MKTKIQKNLIILFFIIFSLTYALMHFWHSKNQESSYLIELSIKLPKEGNSVEVFFDDDNKGYSAQKSVVQTPTLQDGNYIFHIPTDTKRFRIDPGSSDGPITISSLRVTQSNESILINLVDLKPLSQIENLRLENDKLMFDSAGTDPYLDLAMPNEFIEKTYTSKKRDIFSLLATSTLASIFITLLIAIFQNSFMKSMHYLNQKIGKGRRIDCLIYLDKTAITYILTLIVIGILMILFKINLSSIAMYDAIFPSSQEQKFTTIIGNAAAIRSDEWVVQTPFLLSQLSNELTDTNLNIGGEKSPLLTAVPVANASIIFQPKFWGFLILDTERGYSWLWAYKTIGLLLAFFFLFLLLTKNNSLLSILGSMLIYCSAFSQWWLSSNYPEIIIAFALIVFSFCSLLFSTKKILIFVYCAIFIIFSINFILHLYPPFLVPLIYLGAFIVLGVFFSKENNSCFRNKTVFKFSCIGLCGVILGSIIFYFYTEAKTTIDAIQNTSYPGKRVSVGGGELWRVFTGYFDTFSFHQSKFPSFLGNVCEASNFYIFSLIIFTLVFGKQNLRLFKDPITLSLLAYIFIMLIWVSVGFGEAISHYSLMELSHPSRTLIGIGIANIILFITVLSSHVSNHENPKNIIFLQFLIAIILSCGIAALGLYLNGLDEAYYSHKRIILSTIIFFCIAALFLLKKIKLLSIFFVLLSISALKVNPILYGIGGFYNKDIYNFLEKNNLISSDRVAFFDSTVHPQYLKAIGVNVFGGASFLPNHQDMSILDSTGRNTDIWNRYAHIQLSLDIQSTTPQFLLNQADLYTISLNPCGDEFGKLNIKYLAFLRDVDELIGSCAQKINLLPVNGVYFYKIL